jgi:hypothetical protein
MIFQSNSIATCVSAFGTSGLLRVASDCGQSIFTAKNRTVVRSYYGHLDNLESQPFSYFRCSLGSAMVT